MIKVRYRRGGESILGSVKSLLTQDKAPSHRMMIYLIELTEILVRNRVISALDLSDLAQAYEVDVEVEEIVVVDDVVDDFIDVTSKKLPEAKK